MSEGMLRLLLGIVAGIGLGYEIGLADARRRFLAFVAGKGQDIIAETLAETLKAHGMTIVKIRDKESRG